MEIEFLTLAKQLGPNLALLVVAGGGCWRICRWLAANVITPLVESHKSFLSDIATATKTNSDTQLAMAGTLERIEETLSLLERKPS